MRQLSIISHDANSSAPNKPPRTLNQQSSDESTLVGEDETNRVDHHHHHHHPHHSHNHQSSEEPSRSNASSGIKTTNKSENENERISKKSADDATECTGDNPGSDNSKNFKITI